MSDKYLETNERDYWRRLKYRDNGGTFVVLKQYQGDIDGLTLAALVRSVEDFADWLSEPVIRFEYDYDATYVFIEGEALASPEEMGRIETAEIARKKRAQAQRAAAKARREKKEAAERKEFERLAKKYANQD